MNISLLQQTQRPGNPHPIVIIGAGGIVRDAHLPAYRLAAFSVSSIYDLDRKKAQALASDFEVPRVCSSLEEAVATAPPGAIFDCALPASEIAVTLERLPDDSAVLIQKPLGEDLAAARAIRDLCRRKRLKAAVNFQLRYAPCVIAARDAIAQGMIGELHDVEVRVTTLTPWHLWPFFVGIPRVEVLYHSVHYIDLVRSFLGDPKGVHAKTVKHPKALAIASTRSAIILDYGDLIRATITTNHGHDFGPRHQESYIKWEGTRGAIKVRLGLLLDYPRGVPDVFEYCLHDGGPPAWKPVPLQGSWYPHAFMGTMSSLMRFAAGETSELPTAVDDACRTMAVVEAAYASSADGATPIPSPF